MCLRGGCKTKIVHLGNWSASSIIVAILTPQSDPRLMVSRKSASGRCYAKVCTLNLEGFSYRRHTVEPSQLSAFLANEEEVYTAYPSVSIHKIRQWDCSSSRELPRRSEVSNVRHRLDPVLISLLSRVRRLRQPSRSSRAHSRPVLDCSNVEDRHFQVFRELYVPTERTGLHYIELTMLLRLTM
jgi:hypothetical protein